MRGWRGFTLVELMIVISILLLLTLFVVWAIGDRTTDRVRSASRIAQSAFLGARDRALHARERRGIRIVPDQDDPSTATSFVYMQPMGARTYENQSIQLERVDVVAPTGGPLDADGPEIFIVHGFDSTAVPPGPVDWFDVQANFSVPGKIRIPSQTGQWFTFSIQSSGPYALAPGNQYLVLTTPFPDNGTYPQVVAYDRTGSYSSCDIELLSELLPMHQPIPLPSGVVVDLFWSSLPPSWYAQQSIAATAPIPPGYVAEGPDPAIAGNIIVRQYFAMDMMFTPRGAVTGAVSATGPIHFLLNDVRDAAQNLNPLSPANVGEKLILSVFPQTGHVASFPIDMTDANADGYADDLYRFARVGSVAGQ